MSGFPGERKRLIYFKVPKEKEKKKFTTDFK
jgi:hypothetical protein